MKKKRIFIVNQADDSQKYGVGKYINEIIEEAKQRKKDFDVISILIGSSDSIQVEKIKTSNITHLKIPRQIINGGNFQGLPYLYSRAAFILLTDFYQFNESDTFHFNSNMQHFLMVSIKEFTKAKIIYTIHVSLWKTYYNNNFNKFISDFKDPKCEAFHKRNIKYEVKNCELSDRIICISDTMKKDVVELYNIPENKIFYVPNGIKEQKNDISDVDEIKQIKEKSQITKNDFVFLYIGRLIPQKGVVELTNYFKDILGEKPNIKLLLIGDGPLKESLIKECTDFKEKIIFTGYIPGNKVKLYYKIANALIFPSLNEESGYVILEAMAYKVPMIITKIDTFKAHKNTYSCLKIDVNEKKELDEGSFKENINLMVEATKLRKDIAKNAYDLYLKKYSSKVMFDSTYL